MKVVFALLFALFTFSIPAHASAEKITKETILSQGKKRTYYLFVPETLKQTKTPAPLLVLLHGSNRNGSTLVEKWKELAKKEGFILVGPDSVDSSQWATPVDGPQFLYELVESLKTKYPINERRIYLFGHSGGASFALLMSLFESQYFAATAIHAGALPSQDPSLIGVAKRKTPISIQVGTQDESFPLKVVRATRDSLNASGFSVELTEIAGHTHWYYDSAPKINRSAWDFLRKHELAAEPRFEQHNFRSADKSSRAAGEEYNRGVERHRAGELDAAVVSYTRAIELDPKMAEAYNNRGVAYMNKTDYEKAVADFSRSIEINPTESAYSNRGSAYRALKKPVEAIADYTRAIELKPSAEAFYNRAVALQERGDKDLALADYTRAIELEPQFAPAYAYRGILLLQQGRDADAQRDFDAAFGMNDSLRADLESHINQIREARSIRRP